MPGAPRSNSRFSRRPRAPAHHQPRVGEPAALRIMTLECGARVGMADHRQAEGLGDRIDGHVVMRRPDAAGREEIVVGCAKGVHGRADPRTIVRHHAHLRQADPLDIEPDRDRRDVSILDAAGKDLVADDQQPRRPIRSLARGDLAQGSQAARLPHIPGSWKQRARRAISAAPAHTAPRAGGSKAMSHRRPRSRRDPRRFGPARRPGAPRKSDDKAMPRCAPATRCGAARL